MRIRNTLLKNKKYSLNTWFILKTLFNSLGIVYFIKTLWKYRNIINTILIPFYTFYGIIWTLLLITTFLYWKLPTHIPLPFIGNSIPDRVLLLIGIIIGITYYLENKNKY